MGWGQGLGGAQLSGAQGWAGAGLRWRQARGLGWQQPQEGLSLPAYPLAAALSRPLEAWAFFATGNSHPAPGTTSCCWGAALPGSLQADLYSSRDGFLLGVSPSTPELAAWCRAGEPWWCSRAKLLPERREGGWSTTKTAQEWRTLVIPSCKAFCQDRWLNLKPLNFPNNELTAELFYAYGRAAGSHIGWVCGISHFIFLHAFSWIVFQFASKPFLSMWSPWLVACVCSDRDSCLFFAFVESTKNWKYSWDCISLTSFYSLQMSG